ncbi:DUF6197 family protein [Streptomyces griseus]|uniref:DUF6197 family protein n=1 Tax=Streptomyces griseus TaxID=1911 RepID=UPI0033D5F23C
MNQEFVKINLERAAEYISKHGWHQGDYYSYRATDAEKLGLPADQSHPPACALGAILATGPATADAVIAAAAIGRLATYLDLPDGVGISVWNDAVDRTAEDVILALKTAAETSTPEEVVAEALEASTR